MRFSLSLIIATAAIAAALPANTTIGRRGINGTPTAFTTEFAYFTSADGSSLLSYITSSTLFSATPNAQSPTLTLSPSTVYQTMDGAGSALTDATAMILANARASNIGGYTNVMKDLFNPFTGLGLLRIPIGASDFGTSIYTLADTVPTISPLSNPAGAISQSFSFSRVANLQLPIVKDALTVRPKLKVVLSNWSPPAWMKQNGALSGGYLKSGYEAVLAEYLAQTAKAYTAAGVPIYAITIQNEPSFLASYPSLGLTPQQQNVVAGSLRSRLAAYGLSKVQLLVHDDNFGSWSDARDAVLANPNNVDGTAWHCYVGDPTQLNLYQSALASAGVSGKAVHFSECSPLDDGASTVAAMDWWYRQLVYPTTGFGAKSVSSWNLLLDANHGPRLASSYCTNCEGSALITTGITYTDAYYTLQHLSAVSADASAYGSNAGPAVRIGLMGETSCLIARAFAAPLSQTQRRYGVELENTCDYALVVKLQVGSKVRAYNAAPGLHSLVFTG